MDDWDIKVVASSPHCHCIKFSSHNFSRFYPAKIEKMEHSNLKFHFDNNLLIRRECQMLDLLKELTPWQLIIIAYSNKMIDHFPEFSLGRFLLSMNLRRH